MAKGSWPGSFKTVSRDLFEDKYCWSTLARVRERTIHGKDIGHHRGQFPQASERLQGIMRVELGPRLGGAMAEVLGSGGPASWCQLSLEPWGPVSVKNWSISGQSIEQQWRVQWCAGV
ncbi:hypothetical protein LIA77_09535 [Sarocladium implicatum]|nr:hypothetical protein LIA77_09535 [Sarocladium implicatum]